MKVAVISINGTATYEIPLESGIGPKTFERRLADPKAWLETGSGKRVRASAVTAYVLETREVDGAGR